MSSVIFHSACVLYADTCPPHQRSVSDMVHGVEGPAAAADGGLIQCVAVGLTVAVVDRQVLHVHRSL